MCFAIMNYLNFLYIIAAQPFDVSGRYSGKAFMPYGDGDYIMTGDDVISPQLRTPTTIYVGDGSVQGFSFVTV